LLDLEDFTTDKMVLKQFERLPKTVIPTHYNLHLKPDLVKCTFEGFVAVNIEVRTEVRHTLQGA